SSYIIFMERSFHVPFSPERNTGLMVFDDVLKGRLGWQLGVFRNGPETGDDVSAGEDYNVTLRVGGLAMRNADASRLLHLGAGFSRRSPKADEYKITSRASSHLSPKYVSTGTLTDVDNVQLFNAEVSLMLGPLNIQGERINALVDIGESQNFSFSSYYGQVSYFLTGEQRVYKNAYSGFDRVKPKSNVGEAGGKGAWEVAFRYSTINLNDGPITGGKMNEITFGVNWYLNPATRIMANYVNADLDGVGNVGIIQTRFQVDF
ncbi:MAG: porin, partial [Saprospiraceae bacterium]|nr:porin [Saprospiraceae bacterium]